MLRNSPSDWAPTQLVNQRKTYFLMVPLTFYFLSLGYLAHPRKDKYNRKLKKYYVDVDEEDEDEEAEEEREKEEHTGDVWV